ncbi:MAG: TonB-dependent receptor [Rhodospirillaceae bacterium]|nr:TonB-dependent receptor [Rhodospirillaceae bacterium]
MTRGMKNTLLLTTILALGAGEAAAQIEEITVTARKRAESLQEVPLTVTAFTADMIQRQGLRTIAEVAKFTPGLSYDKGFAPQDTRPNIRGLPTTRGRPPIGILLDGVDISSESIGTAGGSSLMNLKLVDVERIEVVKGPQSALYGRVAFGGAINYISKQPSTETPETTINTDLATYGLTEIRGATNAPISDKMAVRVNALYSRFNGFYDNEVSGKRIGGWETWGLAGAFRVMPTENADFTLRLSYSDDKSEPRPSYYFGQQVPGRNSVLALPSNAVGLRLGLRPLAGAPDTRAPLPASIPYPKLGEEMRGDRVLLSVDPLTGKDYEGGRVKPFIANLIGKIEFGDLTLESWTGYTDASIVSRTDADFFGAPAAAVTLPTPGTAEPLPAAQISDFTTDAEQFSQELRLGDLDAERFRWSVGGLFWKEDYSSINASIFLSGFARTPPLAPANWSAARELQVRGPIPGDLNVRNTKHWSGYAMAEFDITEQLEISAEGRYSDESFDYVFGRAIALSIVPATGALIPFAYPATPPFTPTSSSDFFAPRVTLNYKPNDDMLFYASASKGVKPAGFLNVAVVFDPADAFYRPEKLWNYEAGFKTAWADNTVRFNGAYFHMIYSDRINQLLVPDTRSPQGTSTLVVNQGQAKVDGVEAELTWAPVDGWTVNAAYTYLDPRFTESEVPSTAALGVAGSGNCRVGTVGTTRLTDVCFTNTNGNQLEQSAKHAFSAGVSYTAPLTGDWDLVADLSAQYRSKRFQSPDNLIWLASYWNADAKIGVQNDAYSILAYVDNLFDDRKPKSAQTYGDPFISLSRGQSPPVLAYTTYAADKRQMGIRLGAKF